MQFQKAYAMEPKEPEQRILLISQPLFEDHLLEGGLEAKKEHIRQIIESAPLPIAIKPHPREDRQWYMENFQPAELRVYPADKDINEAIQECSHAIGYFSTALINALILKRPVGIIRWVDDHAYVLNLDTDEAAFTLNKPEDLLSLMQVHSTAADPANYAFDRDAGIALKDSLAQLLKH